MLQFLTSLSGLLGGTGTAAAATEGAQTAAGALGEAAGANAGAAKEASASGSGLGGFLKQGSSLLSDFGDQLNAQTGGNYVDPNFNATLSPLQQQPWQRNTPVNFWRR